MNPADGRVLFANAAWCALFGYGLSSPIGTRFDVLLPPGEQDSTFSGTATLDELRATGAWQGRVCLQRPDGQRMWVQAHVTTVRDEELGDLWVGLYAEPQRRWAPDAEGGSVRDDLDLVEALAHVGTWEIDLDTMTVYCSKQMLVLHGLSAVAEPTSLAVFLHRVHPEDLPRLVEAYSNLVAGEELELEYRVIHPDGAVRHMAVRVGDNDPDGASHRVGGVIVDVSDRYDREALIGDALLREQQMTAQLRSVDEQKDLFLRAVSHDLRTPLTIMQGFAGILVAQDDRLAPEVRRDYAARIESGAHRLHEQLVNLLDLDRLARGVLDPYRQPVELRQLAADVVAALDLADRVTVLGDALVVAVDPAQVERILENLIANAARHTPGTASIEVRSTAVDDGVLIAVDDDGPGIPADLHEEVFNVFRKVHPSSSGTGVGLPLVQRFAELHGGRAWVQDRSGGGAAFRVFLPSVDAASL